jgi:hypothetical protein
MHGPIVRMIKKQGAEYTVRNADGSGGRDTADYSDDGTVVGVLEQRGMPRTATDSSGTDVESDLEIRVIPDDSVPIREAGSADGYPTKLVHPQGQTYRVLATMPEDSGVTVLTVVRD